MSDNQASAATSGAAVPDFHQRLTTIEAEKAELQRRHDLLVAERDDLRRKLDAVSAERDKHVVDLAGKAALEQKFQAAVGERDGHRLKLDAVIVERDRLAAEASALAKLVAEAKTRVNDAVAEAERLRAEFESRPLPNAFALLLDQAGEQLQKGIEFLRTKIPENHPALPWFDSAVRNGTKLGCLAVRSACAFMVWATPHAKTLLSKAQSEIEARIAKK